ncbi:MAG: glycine cleavage system aminomethyltransferase GcvT, partial [Proteobacteria bacterium]|nr:glycine cleavage system aminomethyltransferase GcvT [Pseudomonadota bacterium]
TLLCNPEGGVVDDVIVYRLKEDHFLLVVNASNTDKVYEWIKENTRKDVSVENTSESTAQISLQGPMAEKALSCVSEFNLSRLRPFFLLPGKVCGINMAISRTGYTGEEGFEFYLNPQYAKEVFEGILDGAKNLGIKPVGLGARDTLRLEMGYPLYGAELTSETTPVEAGLKRFINFGREDFIGKDVILKQIESGVEKKLVGFEMTEKGIARGGYKIFNAEGEIGSVTSGTHSPTLEKAIGMGYVKTEQSEIGSEISIEIRGKQKSAVVTKRPFYKREELGTR